MKKSAQNEHEAVNYIVFVKIYNEELIGALTYTFMFAQLKAKPISYFYMLFFSSYFCWWFFFAATVAARLRLPSTRKTYDYLRFLSTHTVNELKV